MARLSRVLQVRVLFLSFTLLSGVAMAQLNIGVQVINSYNTLQAKVGPAFFNTVERTKGLGVGLSASYRLSARLHLGGELNLTPKNYTYRQTGDYDYIYQQFKNSYAEIPLSLKYNIWGFGANLDVFVTAGMYGAYWLSSKTSGTIFNIYDSTYTVNADGESVSAIRTYSFSEKYEFNPSKDKRFEWGYLFGIECAYTWRNKFIFRLTGKYQKALTGTEKIYMINQELKKNKTILVQLGFARILNFNKTKREKK